MSSEIPTQPGNASTGGHGGFPWGRVLKRCLGAVLVFGVGLLLVTHERLEDWMGHEYGWIWHSLVPILLLGVGALWLAARMDKRHTGRARNRVVQEAGSALIVAAVIIVSVEVAFYTKFLEHERRISELSSTFGLQSAFGDKLGQMLGDELLHQPLRYNSFDTKGIVDLRTDGNGVQYVVLEVFHEIVVSNLSDSRVQYLVSQSPSGMRDGHCYKLLSVKLKPIGDVTGNGTGPDDPTFDYSGDSLENEIDIDGCITRFRKEVELEARGTYRLTISKRISGDPHDFYNLQTRYPCDEMSSHFVFSADLEGEGNAAYPKRRWWRRRTDGPSVSVNIDATVLPFQGIFMAWRPKDRQEPEVSSLDEPPQLRSGGVAD